MKLFEHFKLMQEMAEAYITPDVYITIDGARIAAEKRAKPLRDASFAQDMLHMLDGPEQREAEAELDDFLAKHLADREALLTEFGEVRQNYQNTNAQLNGVLAENNDLRSRLMASEMAYAKLRGYLEGKLDSQPPVMVPQQRESFHAQLPDASGAAFGTTSLDWRQDGAGRTTKHWYHR